MPILALFTRTLLFETRSPFSAILRAGILILILISVYWIHTNAATVGAPGRRLFSLIAQVNFWFITFAAISIFATVITREREETTLPLLRMTDLDPIAILLGNSASRLMAALLLLVVQLPFTLLSLTLGGIALDQILRIYATLAGYLVLASSVGLFFSVACLRSRLASALTAVALLTWALAHPALAHIYDQLVAHDLISSSTTQSASEFLDGMRLGTPLGAISAALKTGFSGPVFSSQVGITLALALGAFGAAWLIFRWNPRDDLAASPTLQRTFQPGRAAQRRGFRSEAIAWMVFEYIAGGKKWRRIKIGVYAVLVVAIMMAFPGEIGPFFNWRVSFAIVLLGLVAAFVEISLVAGRVFSTEIEDNTLSTLSLVPMKFDDLIAAKIRGCHLALSHLLWFAVPIGIAFPMPPLPAMLYLVALVPIGLHGYVVANVSLNMRWGSVFFALFIEALALGIYVFLMSVAPLVGLILFFVTIPGVMLLAAYLKERLRDKLLERARLG